MGDPSLPFDTGRLDVYTPEDLFGGFDPDVPASYGETADFARFRWFVATGRGTPTAEQDAIARAMHDAHLTFDLGGLIAGRRAVGIMGGHRMPRDSEDYLQVATLARDLARRDMLVCTGGGPGAMEAAHLGAALARHPDGRLGDALAVLAEVPRLGDVLHIVDEHGNPDPALVEETGRWFAPAWRVHVTIEDPARSLSIPTWHYGHEPSNPFATRIAKLFQNSIREDGLLTIARQGLVFTRGSAGTLQEVFQDAAQNFYAVHPEFFSPMVFLDRDYWSRVLPVGPLLDALFALASPEVRAKAEDLILVTDDIAEAAAHLDAFSATRSRLER